MSKKPPITARCGNCGASMTFNSLPVLKKNVIVDEYLHVLRYVKCPSCKLHIVLGVVK